MIDPASVHVRTARESDLPAMRRVAASSFDRERVHRAGIVDLLHFRPAVDADLRVVAVRGGELIGFAFASIPPMSTPATGHIDAWAVHPVARLRGVGGALLTEVEKRLSNAGCRWVLMGGTTWFYAWPGIDLAYTAALVAAERAGFTRESLVHNMDVDLTTWIPAAPTAGAPVRRARRSDHPALHDLIGAHFQPVWQHEVDLALERPRPTLHVAERDHRIIGFAAYGIYQPDLFGPLGTDPAQRGAGVGLALLHACLHDMAATGLPVAQIGWIGPARFYARAAGARIGRSFAVFRKTLDGQSGAPSQRGSEARY